MKTGVAALVGGIVGSIGVLCFLVAFGTDYWVLASDECGGHGRLGKTPNTSAAIVVTHASEDGFLTLHHEGFFWHSNQPESKTCIRGYLFPLPVAVGAVPHPKYDATAVFRGFWTVFIILALVASLVGGFLLVCAVPFTSPTLYKLGGIFLITAAFLFLTLVGLFVLWKELVDVRGYILQERGEGCPDAPLEVHYGWSFFLVVAGIPLSLLSGLLFYFTGRHLHGTKN
ncbi:transmembrane protein 182-like isoform X2 [Denticeps clupeoides]|uniref:transmembrane protein 182-like isoform X2 n=1 Tax=Denticeps clupeoides TaxID=299321 RepID=UPI0010A579A1|nr:transmembrane protein 182-like isoform X2 [Denticeps clupeoides]